MWNMSKGVGSMGAWIEFKYRNTVGKEVSHTCNVNSNKHLSEILDRYFLEPIFLFDIKRNGKPLSAERLSKILYGGNS